jgi:hypothetical protein
MFRLQLHKKKVLYEFSIYVWLLLTITGGITL